MTLIDADRLHMKAQFLIHKVQTISLHFRRHRILYFQYDGFQFPSRNQSAVVLRLLKRGVSVAAEKTKLLRKSSLTHVI